jgi:hypothetical protein
VGKPQNFLCASASCFWLPPLSRAEYSKVDFVLMTPLQAYAAGNIPLFENETACISKGGWIEDFHALKYEMHIPRKLRVPDEVLYYLMLNRPAK